MYIVILLTPRGPVPLTKIGEAMGKSLEAGVLSSYSGLYGTPSTVFIIISDDIMHIILTAHSGIAYISVHIYNYIFYYFLLIKI